MSSPRILQRYVLRDVVVYSLLGLFVCTLVIVGQNLLTRLPDLLSAGLSPFTVFKLLGIILPSYLSYAVPTSLLFGVLISFGRMSADGEIIAMRASGISIFRMLPPVMILGGVCSLAMGYLLFELEPSSRTRLRSLTRELTHVAELLEVGRFRSMGGRTVYVAEKGDETCPYKGVLIGDLSESPRPVYINAQCALIAPEGKTGLNLQLSDGSIHFSDADRERYRRVSFSKLTLVADLSEDIGGGAPRGRDLTFSKLLEYRARFSAGEEPELRGDGGASTIDAQIHRRVAFPMASVLLGILAVPLGMRPVRSGRSAGAITAIGVMGLYWCMFQAGELATEAGIVPGWLGLWAPNLLVAALSVYLLRRSMFIDS